jgi:signal transduction histidine kinase/CheY-like chemotaxis protein
VLDEKSLTEALFSFLTPLMAIQVTGLLIAGLCFYFSARFFIFFPLIQLIHNINVARSSKQTIQVTHSSKGEIGLLIDRYNELMESLGKHQKELIEAKEKSETAAKAKSEFLATMTHELRTPLNGVIGISALLKQLNLDKKQEYYVDVINQSGSQLLSIINDILDFSKIESGNLELSNITFNLPQMVQQVSTLMEVQAAQKSLEFSYIDTIDQPDTMIFADDTRLRQVLINLLGNAIKFTQEGHIHIALSKDDTPLPKLDPSRSSFPFKVTISDTGIGLTQNQMDKLFERFTQADASTTRKFGGTGLGLAICKNICDKMEGKIEVTSQPNEGTVFTVRFNLPLADESKQEEQRYSLENALVPFSNQRSIDAIEALWNEHPLSETPERLKVLVVDDTFINLQIAASLIESEGIRVTTAEDGIQAIDAIYRDDFDLILMDCLMPKMDGYQATQSIRARENELNLARTPVIALTASALQETKEKCMAADMDDFVSKPFDSQLLISTIKWWLTKSYGLNENK